MAPRVRELALPAAVAGVLVLLLGVAGLQSPAFTDYELEAEPALNALRAGDLGGFLELAPAYGGSLVLRLPFALLPGLWGGGDLAVFQSMAAPCLIAVAVLAVVLWSRARARGRSELARWGALVLVAASPLTLRALEIGHPEELLGAVLCVGAALAAGDRRPVLSGALLGLAIANKPWAVLAVVPVLAIAPAGRMRLLGTAAFAALAVMLPLAIVAGAAVKQVGAAATDSAHIFQPWQLWWFLGDSGQAVMGSFSAKPTGWRVPPEWLTSASHALVVLIPVAICALLLPRVSRRPWHEGLLLLAFALLLRCLLDPWNVSYYELPFLFAFVAWEIHARSRPPVLSLVLALLCWLTLVALPEAGVHPDVQAGSYLAWSIPLALLLGVRLIAPARLHWTYGLGQGRSGVKGSPTAADQAV